MSRRRRTYSEAAAGDTGVVAPWTPLNLGASLIEWLDAEDESTFTKDGGTGIVSSWRDKVNGRDYVQAVGGLQPIWNATSFNNRPGLTFDGTDDELTCPNTTGLPVGTTDCEEWALVDQVALAADTTVRHIASTGTGSTTSTRAIRRIVTTAVNRGSASIGLAGATSSAPTQTATNFSGRCVYRFISSAGNYTVEINGVAGTTLVGNAPATGITRKRIGAMAGGAGGTLFWNGLINTLLVTTVLSVGDATFMYAYLNARNA